MSSDKIKCTFEGCYQTFDTVASMKKHKDKADDEVHEWYCKKCDEDCEDDIAYLIHQIQSRKHIACPVCGAEFKSEGGRDRHVGINHQRKQELKCPGCKNIFESASRLMAHIEGNKCKTISQEDFYKHRSELEIERDAIEREELKHRQERENAVRAPVGSDPDSNGGISLLDNGRSHLETDWQGNPRYDTRPSYHGAPTVTTDQLSREVSNLSMSKYPALNATVSNNSGYTQSAARPAWPTNSTWVDDDVPGPGPQPTQPRSVVGQNNVWASNKITSSSTSSQRQPSSNVLDSASSVNLLGSMLTTRTAATRGTVNQTVAATGSGTRSDFIPPSTRPENPDPNAPYAQIQTRPGKPTLASRLDLHNFWDSILGCYICPGSMCGQRLHSIQEFEQHLLSSVHVGGKVQCPSCLKKFKTTAALVAHAESGSLKCDLRNSTEYDLVLRSITAGLIRVDGTRRDGSVKYDSIDVNEW